MAAFHLCRGNLIPLEFIMDVQVTWKIQRPARITQPDAARRKGAKQLTAQWLLNCFIETQNPREINKK